MLGLHFSDQPFPKGQRFGVRIVDPKDLYSLFDPEQDNIPQGDPKRRQRVTIEVDVDDVFVLFWRIFSKLDAAIGPPVEPFGMFLDPRMVWRALDGKIQRNL